MGEVAAQALLKAMAMAAGRKKGRVRLVAVAGAYVAFARENVALYPLLAARRSANDVQVEAIAVWQLILDEVAEFTGKRDATAEAVALWSFLHGFAALEAAGKFGVGGSKGGYERGLSTMLARLIR